MALLLEALKSPPSIEARRRLERLLDNAIKAPLPTPLVQQLRALEVLESIGTKEASQVLDSLTAGDPDAWLTQEAKAALLRLENRPGN